MANMPKWVMLRLEQSGGGLCLIFDRPQRHQRTGGAEVRSVVDWPADDTDIRADGQREGQAAFAEGPKPAWQLDEGAAS